MVMVFEKTKKEEERCFKSSDDRCHFRSMYNYAFMLFHGYGIRIYK